MNHVIYIPGPATSVKCNTKLVWSYCMAKIFGNACRLLMTKIKFN